MLSEGLASRIVARSGEKVPLKNGGESSDGFHPRPDFAATFAVPPDMEGNQGGWAYVSNSEVPDLQGGVGALYFDKDGDVVDYKMLLNGTTMNCAGKSSAL